jgi:hypothetical protein
MRGRVLVYLRGVKDGREGYTGQLQHVIAQYLCRSDLCRSLLFGLFTCGKQNKCTTACSTNQDSSLQPLLQYIGPYSSLWALAFLEDFYNIFSKFDRHVEGIFVWQCRPVAGPVPAEDRATHKPVHPSLLKLIFISHSMLR